AAERPAGAVKEDQPAKEEMRGRPSVEEGGEEGRDKEPKVEIRITDAAGKLVRKMDGPAKLGMNRATWDFGRDSFRRPPMGERGAFFRRDSGPAVGPGTYTVTVKLRDKEAKETLQVEADAALGNTE